jgi:FkbM family methyltransferase
VAERTKILSLLCSLYRRLFARTSCYYLNRLLFELSLRGLGVLNSEDEAASGELYLMDSLLSRLESPLVLDVGANQGRYATLVRQRVPASSVWAFEPHPETFKHLAAVAEQYGFKAVSVGMGDQAGSFVLYDRVAGEGTEHASLYREVIEDIHDREATALDVAITTLDQFVCEQHIEQIGLLKIDTEGNEYRVLLGGKETLEAGKVAMIQIEFNEMNTVSRVFFRDFVELLPGFAPFRLLPGGLLPLTPYRPLRHELFGFQNILFIRNDLRNYSARNYFCSSKEKA